jgi:mitogen-activated protein kinase 1/3
VGPRYSISKKIGSGSFGIVCEACNTETGQRVAIKQVCRLFEDIMDTKRLLREVTILKAMNHPNVVKVIEILTPGTPDDFNEIYIVMEHA